MADLKHVFVTGDFVLDSHIYEGKRHQFGERRNRGVHEKQEQGGAALVHYLLDELSGKRQLKESRKIKEARLEELGKRRPKELSNAERDELSRLPGELKKLDEDLNGGIESHLSVKLNEERAPALAPGQEVPPYLKAYAVWKELRASDGRPPEQPMWLTEDPMGFGGRPEVDTPFEWPQQSPPAAADVVVLSEGGKGGMGFRDQNSRWPNEKLLDDARWIVLKTTHPFMQGSLWKELGEKDRPSRLVVIVSSTDLRRDEAYISGGLSWDATIESTLSALASNGCLAGLTRCRHLIVAFGTEGGLWLDMRKEGGGPRAHLVYDASAVEGEHRTSGRGTAFGALSCLTASVVWHLARNGDAPDLETALEGGFRPCSICCRRDMGPRR